jgi:hypothetical protein
MSRAITPGLIPSRHGLEKEEPEFAEEYDIPPDDRPPVAPEEVPADSRPPETDQAGKRAR